MRKSTRRKIENTRQEYLTKQVLLKVAESMPGGRRRIAYHEASHAIVLGLFSFSIDYVTAQPEGVLNKRHVTINSFGYCQPDEVVPTGFRHLCFDVSALASIPTEKKLGIPLDSECFTGDVEIVFNGINDDIETKKKYIEMVQGIAAHLISRDDVWGAISELAELLLQQKQVDGDKVREIVSRYIPKLIVTETEQIEVDKDWSEHGGQAIAKWVERRFGRIRESDKEPVAA